MQEMSVHTELDDLTDVIEHIKNTGIAGDNPVFVLGMSQGGYVAAEAAARRPDDIAGLLLFFPAFNINDLISAHFSSPEEVPEYVTIFDQTVSRKYFTDAMSEPIIEDMEAYPNPVLILHGSEDDVVPYSCSKNAAEHFPNAEFHLIEGAGHGFFLQDAETAFGYCMEFLSPLIPEKE
jgi:pimeloyl-ACP methyl ester carboxylesterase